MLYYWPSLVFLNYYYCLIVNRSSFDIESAITGQREFSYHEWYNYEHYWTQTASYLNKKQSESSVSPPSLLVLRTEHLLEDWSNISKEVLFRQVNKGIRGTHSIIPEPNISTIHSSESSSSTKVVDTSHNDEKARGFWINLCHAMCPEIQIYKQILHRANNLNTSQVKESIREVQVLCPEEPSSLRDCPGIPQFPLIMVPRRQYMAETKKRLFIIKK